MLVLVMSLDDNSMKNAVKDVLKNIDLGAIRKKIENGEFDINKLAAMLKSILGEEEGEKILENAKKIADSSDDTDTNKYYK